MMQQGLLRQVQKSTVKKSDPNPIHLINVSRANMRHKYIREYLNHHGISEATLRAGKRVIFIDTGFSGTIPGVIMNLFSPEAQKQIHTHLIVSSHKDYPSSRAFLRHLNPMINEQSPSEMHGTIVSYEHMPRYTDRSTEFIYEDKEWQFNTWFFGWCCL